MKLATNGSAGVANELGRRADLQDVALDDHTDPVGERGRVLEVVRDEHGGQPGRPNHVTQLGSHRGLRMGVEGGQRLVEEQDGGLACQRARERDTLALATGQR